MAKVCVAAPSGLAVDAHGSQADVGSRPEELIPLARRFALKQRRVSLARP